MYIMNLLAKYNTKLTQTTLNTSNRKLLDQMGKFQFPLQFLLLFTYLPILTYANENSVENIST